MQDLRPLQPIELGTVAIFQDIPPLGRRHSKEALGGGQEACGIFSQTFPAGTVIGLAALPLRACLEMDLSSRLEATRGS